MNKDLKNLKAIVEDLEDVDNGAMIYLSQEEIESLKNIYNLIKKQRKVIRELKKNELDFTTIYITGIFDGEKKCKNKIKQIINKYMNIEEHLKYTNQELFGEDLKNMIIELLEEN